MNDLDKAALFLLVECDDDNESPSEVYAFMSQRYDPRENDPEWGPLYKIGPRFQVEGRCFCQIKTYAGSLAGRMMLDLGKKELTRSILVHNYEIGFELMDPNGGRRPVADPMPIKDTKN